MFNFKRYMKHQQKRINEKLIAILSTSTHHSQLLTAMEYSLMAGGKRIRPILCLAAAEAVTDNTIDILSTAVAIECIHTYSLIHDDLPSMDNDDYRRGKPTCHKAFDEATAILAGDALLTLAFEILSEDSQQNHDPHHQLQVIRMIAHAAGSPGMIEGQMRDIVSETQQLTSDALEQLHNLKTGALIMASVAAGAILAKASDQQKQSLTTYAQNIGLAFQVIDDILNVKGDPKRMGKAVGTDVRLQKNTYPGLMGLDGAERKALELVNNAISALNSFDNRAEPLRGIANYIIYRDQ
ncbi:MAG: geranylgeranyl diphosphate synthase, type II [Candidatus Magnetoglobus multicellularis str. Araruama]|uniref:Geranylgeranyl diphosphate synthase, type II n=1 Tax=Candidatus Magnetoglobus multicellularis str. Araruama TaxID=890399 RepID=A0A1V1P7B2_9BACT|nr:MAG: geranylgeranyl diphosphate synthase, type II [Candidatus Magnetoglobus multicellularis str. Araruama]